jgi:hypothetical protein
MNATSPRQLRARDIQFLDYLGKKDAGLQGLIEELDFLKSIALRKEIHLDPHAKVGLKRAIYLAEVELAIMPVLTLEEHDQKIAALGCWIDDDPRERYRLFFDWCAARDAIDCGMTNIDLAPLPPIKR